MAIKSRHTVISRLAAAAPSLTVINAEGSLSAAAQRLGVHQTALSHRIRSIENLVGHQLFVRSSRGLQPTELGKVILDAAHATEIEWQRALEKLDRRVDGAQVTMSLPSSMALKWIVPAMQRARERGIEISLEVQDEIVQLHDSACDVALRFGQGPYPGNYVVHLSNCAMAPVANPNVVPPGEQLDWLRAGRLPLLFDRRGEADKTGFSWAAYFQAVSMARPGNVRAIGFDRSDLMLQAAIGGTGVALGRQLIVEGDVSQGILEPVGPPVPMKSKYWLVTTPEFAAFPVFGQLLSWLRGEVAVSTRIWSEYAAGGDAT